MSATNREVAHRVFAAEYDDATHSYSESDEERAPNYVVTPTGARVNRVFFVGVLTELERVSDDVLRARVADPTGAFVVYAGQYQPDEMAFLEDAEPPLFVAVTGKARTFSPDDSDRVFTSVRPESINEVDAETRDRWTVQAAEQTLARVATARAAMDLEARGDALERALLDSGVPPSLAAGIPKAFEVYGTTEGYLAAMADIATTALEQVAGEADEVPPLTVAPDDAGAGTVDAAALAAGVDAAVVDLSEPSEGVTAETTSAEVSAGSAADAGSGAVHEGGTDDSDGETGTDDGATATADEPDGSPAGDADEASSETSTEPPETAESTAGADADESTAGAEADGSTAGAEADEPQPGEEADDSPVDATDDPDDDAAADDDIGDFEPAGGGEAEPPSDEEGASEAAEEPDADDTAAEDAAAVDEQDDVLDDEERERLEEEYGTFSTGTEVDDPGEADIEPEAGAIEPEDVDAAAPEDDVADEEPAEESAEEPDDDETPAADVDLEDAAVEVMGDLDDGDGAEWEQVVAALVEDHGADPEAAEEAIQDALMAGKCYEPSDERVKPI